MWMYIQKKENICHPATIKFDPLAITTFKPDPDRILLPSTNVRTLTQSKAVNLSIALLCARAVQY